MPMATQTKQVPNRWPKQPAEPLATSAAFIAAVKAQCMTQSLVAGGLEVVAMVEFFQASELACAVNSLFLKRLSWSSQGSEVPLFLCIFLSLSFFAFAFAKLPAADVPESVELCVASSSGRLNSFLMKTFLGGGAISPFLSFLVFSPAFDCTFSINGGAMLIAFGAGGVWFVVGSGVVLFAALLVGCSAVVAISSEVDAAVVDNAVNLCSVDTSHFKGQGQMDVVMSLKGSFVIFKIIIIGA